MSSTKSSYVSTVFRNNMFAILEDSDSDNETKKCSNVLVKKGKVYPAETKKSKRIEISVSKNQKIKPTGKKAEVVISFSNDSFPSLSKNKKTSIHVFENWKKIPENIKVPPILPSKKMTATEPTKEELSTSTLQYSIEKALESKYIYKKSILHDWADDEYWNSDDEDYEEI
jgi:hypothetical protein